MYGGMVLFSNKRSGHASYFKNCSVISPNQLKEERKIRKL